MALGDSLDYQVVVSPKLVNPTFQLGLSPSPATIDGAGRLGWTPTEAGLAEFRIDVFEGGVQVLEDRFTVWVVEGLSSDAPRVLASAGFEEPDAVLSLGVAATSMASHVDNLPCPPGVATSTAGDGVARCRVSDASPPIGPWIVVDRHCEIGACLTGHRYLDTRLSLASIGDGDAVLLGSVYVTHDWNRGAPTWYPVGHLESTPEPSEKTLLAILNEGVQAVLIAREDADGPELAVGGLRMIEASDLEITLAPAYRPGRGELPYAEAGFGPGQASSGFGQRLFARHLAASGHGSWLRWADDERVGVVGHAPEIEDILAWTETSTATLLTDWPSLDGPLPNEQESVTPVHVAGLDGAGTVILVRDTGIDRTHSDFAGRLEPADCPRRFVGCSLRCGEPSRFGDRDGKVCDHGTSVSGAAAGTRYGAAPGASILTHRYFAVREHYSVAEAESRFTRGERVAAVNMSYGPHVYHQSVTLPIPDWDRLLRIGTAPVTSAGNLPWEGACNPFSNYYKMGVGNPDSNIIRVSGVNGSDDFDCTSKTAPFVELAARGERVYTSKLGWGHHTVVGTSFASPRVAGAFAVLRQARPECSVQTILRVLRETGVPIHEGRGGQNFTIPRVNLAAAHQRLMTDPCPPEPPRNLRVARDEDQAHTALRLTWEDHSHAETGFEVRAVDPYLGEVVATAPPNNSRNMRSPSGQVEDYFVLDGLQAGTRYCVSVRAVRQDAPGGVVYSDWVTNENANGCIERRTLPYTAPSPPEVVVVRRDDRTVTFEAWFTATTERLDISYSTSATINIEGFSVPVVGDPNTVEFGVYVGLYGGGWVWIRACADGVCGPAQAHLVYAGAPQNGGNVDEVARVPTVPAAAPTGVRARRVGEQHVSVEWEEPVDDGVDYYELRMGRAPYHGCTNPHLGGCWSTRFFDEDLGAMPRVQVYDPDLPNTVGLGWDAYQVRRCLLGGPVGSPNRSLYDACSAWSSLVRLTEAP